MRRTQHTLLCISAGLAMIATPGRTTNAQVVVDPPRPRHRFTRPARPMVVTEATRVRTHMVDGVADTTVTMVLRNRGGRDGEKILVLPLPKGATADKLELTVGGKLQAGEVLDKNKARRIYETIVARRRDPALLEYVGRDTLRLRVFPIPARGTQKVRIRFRMLLPESGGLHAFEFPARAVEGGTFSLVANIDSSKAIKNVYSPMSGFDVHRKDDHRAVASFECKGRPQRDPIVFYGLSDRDFGLNLLTYRRKDREGYFLMMLAPKRDWKAEKEIAKSITFVLDTSGSMQGPKITQARNALKFFLRSLKPTDEFNVVPFSTEARPFSQSLVLASPENVRKALGFAGAIEARGGTNIGEALGTALSARPSEGKVPIVAFLTDGLATVGTTNTKDLLALCAQKNAAHARVFVFGVGNDVNTRLLDKLSGATGGTRDYVRPGENLEVKVSALFEKLAHPVMTDLRLSCSGVTLSRIAPRRLPDMFRGSRLVVAGRYTGTGAVAIRLEGRIRGARKEFVFDASFPERADEHDFVATIWAQRRVAQLLDAIRLNGQSQELVAEVRRIGKEHGIVTPYTSAIVVEEGQRIARARRWLHTGGPATPAMQRVRRELARAGVLQDRDESESPAAGGFIGAPAPASKKLKSLGRSASGKDAVADSVAAARLLYMGTVDTKARSKLWTTQKVHGFLLHLVGGVWIDARYQKKHETNLRRIEAFSDTYFALLREHPELTKVLSFSTSMLLVTSTGEAVEIVPPKPAPIGK